MKIGSITLALLVIVQLIQVASWCNNTIDYLLLNGWTQYNGAFYKQFGDTILNYADYEMHCQSYGGSLATAKTYEENAFVCSIVTRGRSVVYIGLKNDGVNWRWNDGSPAIYSNWSVGAVFTQTYACAYVYEQTLWTPTDCSWGRLGMCMCHIASSLQCNITNGCSSPYADCTNAICQCRSGYTQYRTLCAADFGSNCDTTNGCSNPYARCINAICQCRSGYILNGTHCAADLGSKCDTTNGCSNPYANCTNATCQCRSGYIQNGTLCAADLGLKCDTTNGCSNTYADCTNATCQCRSRYMRNGTVCAADLGSKCDTTNGCSNPYADCTNATCQCRSGYIQNGTVCAADLGFKCDTTNGCSNPYADCTNSTCQCRSGYIQNETVCAADLGSKCDTTNGCSHPYADCTNATCQCRSGYIKNGTVCAADLGSKCDTTNGCSNPYADCTSVTCQCRSGYIHYGTACVADLGLDCDTTNGCSNPYADCTNSTCQCRSGYIQNGTVCAAALGSTCDTTIGCSNPYADCTNATCQCRSRYIQNGTICSADLGSKCDTINGCSNPYADCTNSTCQCRSGYIQNGTVCAAGVIVESSHSMFTNGTDGFLTCTCMGEDLEWYYSKNNVESIIATTSNSRITRLNQAIHLTTTSNLTFKPVLESDIGWYECRCTTYVNNVKVAGIWMAVYVPAQVNVSPFTQTVKNGSNASISCILINNAEHVSFQWFKDGTLLKNESGNGSISILDITNIVQPANYSCRGQTDRDSGNNATATIYVLNDKNQYCEKEIDNIRNITWDATNSGIVNRKPCQSGFKGVVTRYCKSNGSWEDPVYSQCVNDKLLNLTMQIDNLKDGFQVTNVSTVLTDLKTATNPNATVLVEAELNVVVSMLDKLVSIKSSTGANVSEFTDFLHIASNIIDAGAAHTWIALTTKENKGAETVMQTVEKFVFSDLNKTRKSNSSQTIHTDNINIEIGFDSSIDFQPTRNGSFLNNKTLTTSLSLSAGNMSAYAAVFFRNVSNILQKRIISVRNNFITTGHLDIGPDVMSLQLNPTPEKLTHPLQLIFEAFASQYHTPLCSYWELNATGTGEGAWSSNNCHLVSRNYSGFVCECNHLTNFAILMTTQEFPENGHSVQLSIISAVGCAVSIACLLLTIFRHLQVWRYVKSQKTCIIINICVALIFSYGLFLAGVNRTENKAVCTSIAALLHYFYLTVFFLMLVEGIEIAVSVLFVFFNKSRLKLLLPLAWLIPAGIVGVSLGISRLNGYGNDQNCWLTVRYGLIWAFVGPAALIILCNAVVIVVVIKKMFNTSAFMSKEQKDKAKTSLRSLGVLLPITGVTWILGIFSVNEDLYVFQYLFTIFNSLQGLFIFIFHCLLNNQIRAALREKQRRKQSLETSTTNTRTASNDESRRRVKYIEETSNQIQRTSKWQTIVLQLQTFVSSSKRRTIHNSQPSDTDTDCGSETKIEYY